VGAWSWRGAKHRTHYYRCGNSCGVSFTEPERASDGMALRVPTPTGSVTLSALLEKSVTVDEGMMSSAGAKGSMSQISR